MELTVVILLAFLISAAVVWVMIRGYFPFRLPVDLPNERSLHSEPVPRCGGAAVMLAVSLATVPFMQDLYWLIAIALALSMVSYLDDLRGLPIAFRLMAHFMGAVIAASQFSLPLPGVFLVAMGLAASANLYNFMDGANGLAAGVAVIGFSSYAIAALIGGAPELSLISAAIAAASAGFLIFNFGNARIFLGDAGSIPIGFMAGALGVIGWARGAWSPIFPALVFFPFIVDSVITLLKRVRSGRVVWQSHREHYYQRLIQMGWGHRRVAVTYYGLTLAGSAIGLVFLLAPDSAQWIGVVVFCFVASWLMCKIDGLWEQRS